MSYRFWYLQKLAPFDLIWPVRKSLFPLLALIVMVEVCILPNGLVMLLAAASQPLPVGSSSGNSKFPPSTTGVQSGESMSPESTHST